MTVSDVIQWAGSLLGMAGAWFVSSGIRPRVRLGYWLWVFSNGALIGWSLATHSYGIALMMGYYSITSIRGIRNHG